MQVAASRVPKLGLEPVAAPARAAPRLTRAEKEFADARQDYLDALPIAAFLACLDEEDRACVSIANSQFRAAAAWNERKHGNWVDDIAFLADTGVAQAITGFLLGDEQVRQFEAGDGNPVGGRHFEIRIARLNKVPALGRRCLVSFNDKTQQIETERSLRAEMLRDSLTGLPNRTAFNEQVESVLGDPGFLPGSHAVLVLDMARFSRVNECVGALAGDELLITFARRLC